MATVALAQAKRAALLATVTATVTAIAQDSGGV